MPDKVVVHVDGGARGNPGPAAVAAVATGPGGESLGEASDYIGEATNNVAEYRAVLLGLERLRYDAVDHRGEPTPSTRCPSTAAAAFQARAQGSSSSSSSPFDTSVTGSIAAPRSTL